MRHGAIIAGILLCCLTGLKGQNHSVAREWNEVYLTAIRNDLARPVVHARNLYHSSAAMYDTWAVINERGGTALFSRPADFPLFTDREAAAEEAVSYAAYRLLMHRYANAPGFEVTRRAADSLMNALGYDAGIKSTDYLDGSPAAAGNYVAAQIIDYGMTDGANEARDYENQEYPDPVNPPLQIWRPFSLFNITDVNRWQQLAFQGDVVDQSGNPIGEIPTFLGASWGRVEPFALPDGVKDSPSATNPIYGNSPIYHDPGPPPYYQKEDTAELNFFRWNFETVLKWSSHLDPADGVTWNVSPGVRGNLPNDLPETPAEYRAWYDEDGGQPGSGHPVNPVTGEPYPNNIVSRGDYTRVLAEFWADGPASETPPGHWFAIFNKAMDHPLFERRLWGEGPELDALEYDVKAYLTLGGAMHDAAITAWSIKGKYDYARPITVIRYLSLGSIDEDNNYGYDSCKLRLDPGYIELSDGEELERSSPFTVIKAYAWRGNEAIDSAAIDRAGVGWIDPVLWDPYQRPNFVTPNFAGYISGHSTYSATAAHVLEALTGTPYFPGGVGEFVAKKNEFLVFEEGPSEDIVLQWATYHDAAAETSLSRIWGGIHPPVDDIPGRRIGPKVARDAYERAGKIFRGEITSVGPVPSVVPLAVYPNPVRAGGTLYVRLPETLRCREVHLFDALGRGVGGGARVRGELVEVRTDGLAPGMYVVRTQDGRGLAKVSVR